MSEELLSREDGPVHRLTLNRPARRNALTPDLAAAITRELDLVEERGRAHVVVLGGAGGHFCAGLDLHWLRSLGGVPSLSELQRGLAAFQSAVLAIVGCQLPVIAEIRGSAAGFGLDLALACDMRFAESGATLASAFSRMGLVPDGGSTFTLPRLVGPGHALRFLMTGESVTVFIPSTPGTVTGYTAVLPRSDVVELPITVDEAIRFAVSGGVLVPDRQLPARVREHAMLEGETGAAGATTSARVAPAAGGGRSETGGSSRSGTAGRS